LYLASQFGKKVSKLSFIDSEDSRANTTMEQNILNTSNTNPPNNISPVHIETPLYILFAMAAQHKKNITTLKKWPDDGIYKFEHI
jgi:hypothetical protein